MAEQTANGERIPTGDGQAATGKHAGGVGHSDVLHSGVGHVTNDNHGGVASSSGRQDATAAQRPAPRHAPDVTPLVLIDFDGVINQFPDDKVRCRQNSTDWMKPGDPRIALYEHARWFVPDSKRYVSAGRLGSYRILWSSELVDRLRTLPAQIMWLSTWQPFTNALNMALDVDWDTINWYDPYTGEGRLTGKRRAVLSHLKTGRPIVWIDDEETTYDAGLDITDAAPAAPVLAVGPDSRIGISRQQMDGIERFVAAPPAEPAVRFDVVQDAHEGHWGF
ncbi:hypothetical protein [Bifidobacterium leontopitheci]|uniref:Uncharacterized protein n=1 Tax=Bifidobacterium leontopitheci TaxID=2650774 RepID=A0A6I1GM54_9BIFI|nr:hypothetical protein [Bifidobacterium leontopitheci]KAB7790479.1 hypothetical protein F7D09_0975 [Bifidobacterium leontopitheci]